MDWTNKLGYAEPRKETARNICVDNKLSSRSTSITSKSNKVFVRETGIITSDIKDNLSKPNFY